MTHILLRFAGAFMLGLSLLMLLAQAIGTTLPPNAMLAFISADGSVRVLDMNYRVQVIISDFGESLTWSREGQLAFVSTESVCEIYVWDVHGLVNVSQSALDDVSPVWSADGRLAFMSYRDDRNPEIYVWDGRALTNVSQNPAWDQDPRWNEADQLTFNSLRDGRNGTYLWDGVQLSRQSGLDIVIPEAEDTRLDIRPNASHRHFELYMRNGDSYDLIAHNVAVGHSAALYVP